MICCLCLCDANNYFGLFESHGIKISAVEIIRKHFWFEPKRDDSMSNVICVACWEEVKKFHDFYENVAKAHKLLNENIPSIKSDLNDPQLLNHDQENISSPENKYKDFDWENLNFEKSNSDLKSELSEGLDNDIIVKEKIKPSNNNKETKKLIKTQKSKKKKRGRKRKEPENTSEEENKTELKPDPINDIDENRKDSVDNQENIKSDKVSQFNAKLAQEDERIASFMKMICVICQTECHNFSFLRKHFMAEHKQKGFTICCDRKFFKRSVLVDHVEKHINPESFKCDLCDKICVSRCTLKIHIASAHVNTKPGQQCLHCRKFFKSKTTLKRHQLIHMPDEEKKFQCSKCDKRYPSQNTLSDHIRAYHERRYAGMCDICGKIYNNKKDVRRHRLEVHEGVAKENIKCKLCSKEFSKKYQYNIHKVEEHGDPTQKREYKCKYCDKVSTNSEALRNHVQNVHKAKLKFFCNFCDKVFKSDLSLREHKTTHTGEALYICPHCPRTFTHNSNMHHHRKLVHPIEFEEARRRKNERKESWLQITALQN